MWWRSIVMSLSVCVSVYLSTRISPERRAIFTNFFVYAAYSRCSVLLQRGDEIPRERGNFGVFFPIDSALYSIAYGTYTKTAQPIEMLSGLGW